MKILIVEDTALNLDLLIQLLEDDYEIISARDGEEGIQLALSEHPDLILMDMSLPVKNGWTAVSEIKAIPGHASTPIVGLSAHAMESDHEKAFQHGCDAYLTKPIDEDLLIEMVERLLGDQDQ
jgi:CheY-like chemotaxis protein